MFLKALEEAIESDLDNRVLAWCKFSDYFIELEIISHNEHFVFFGEANEIGEEPIVGGR